MDTRQAQPMSKMPVLESVRVLIRPFVRADLQDVHRLLDVDLHEADTGAEKVETLTERARWLEWAVLNYEQLARLNQPPYGDRAVLLKSTGQLIGACGFVPCLSAFEQLPSFATADGRRGPALCSTEFGLFYAVSPAHQRNGYATEAAQALVDYAFQHLRLKRLIAETTYDNTGSIGVMRKLGMRIEKNSHPDPPWLQVVGILDNWSAGV